MVLLLQMMLMPDSTTPTSPVRTASSPTGVSPVPTGNPAPAAGGPPPNLPIQGSVSVAPRPSTPIPPTPASTPMAPSFSSSVRTMGSDINGLKAGQVLQSAPAPTKPTPPIAPATASPSAPRPSAPTPAVTPAPIPTQSTAVPVPPRPAAPIPPTPTSIPMAGPTPVPPRPAAPTPPATIQAAPRPTATPAVSSLPPSSGRNVRPIFIILVAALVIAGGLGIWLITRTPDTEVVLSPTPTPTVSATPDQPTLERALGATSPLSIQSVGDIGKSLRDSLKTQSVNSSRAKVFTVNDDSGTSYTFKDFLARLLITPPPGANDILDTQQWVVGLYGHSSTDPLTGAPSNADDIADLFEDTDPIVDIDAALETSTPASVKRPFIVVELSDTTSAQEILATWETTIVKDFASVLSYTPKEQNPLNQDFYNGLQIKYIQLPDKDTGFAYTIVDRFLVIASSRDSFRYVIDKLQNR